jgi:hypothetical protein
VAIFFFVLSLGPRLHLLGRVTPVLLPYAALDTLPVFSSVRAIARAGVMVGMAWVVLFAWVLRKQLHRAGAAAVLLALVLIEFSFSPVPVVSARISAVYDQMANLPGTTVVEIPAATNYTAASRALFASGRHGKTVVGNIALERASAGTELDNVRSLPALRQLLWLRTTHLLEDRADFFDQETAETLPDVLRWLDARQLIVHPDSLTSLQLKAVRHTLEDVVSLVPQFVDDTLLYHTPADLAGDGVFLTRDDRWNVSFDATRAVTRVSPADGAHATLYNVTGERRVAQLRFTLDDGAGGSLLIRRGAQVLYDATDVPQRAAGDIKISVELTGETTDLTFHNRLSGHVIMINPQLTVL